jgi:hypothetical protein
MDEISKKCTLDGCTHIYCLECISQWVSESENSCPCCKVAIKTLTCDGKIQEIKAKK